jgi:hypothetical protein
MANEFVIKNGLKVQSGGIDVTGSLTLTDDLVVQGSITAESYIISSSITHMTTSFSSGSTIFGDDNSDTHQFTGSVSISSTLNLDSGLTNANTDTDKFLVLDSSNIVKFRTGANVLSDIGGLSNTLVPQMVVTAAEVLDEATTDVYIPFSAINIFPETNEVAYSRFHAPYDGYIKEIIVHPHSTATSGNCTITPTIGGTPKNAVQETISGTAGTPTTFSFGSVGYSFNDGDDIVLAFDREANDRSRGFSFTIVFIMDATS